MRLLTYAARHARIRSPLIQPREAEKGTEYHATMWLAAVRRAAPQPIAEHPACRAGRRGVFVVYL